MTSSAASDYVMQYLVTQTIFPAVKSIRRELAAIKIIHWSLDTARTELRGTRHSVLVKRLARGEENRGGNTDILLCSQFEGCRLSICVL